MPTTPLSALTTSLPASLSASLPTLTSAWTTVLVAAAAAVVAVLVGEAVALLVRRLGRHHRVLARLAQNGRRPLATLLGLLAVRVSLALATTAADWRQPTLRVLDLLVIAVGAWFLTVAAGVVQDVALLRYRVDVADNRRARQRRTQIGLVRRLVTAAIVVVAVASMLLTIPGAQGAGASVLASAGVLSVVAGLAAQTSLANVFAGLQIAFTDALRVDDVVVVEEEWGNVEDITLTYVVVKLWDERRMILPSTWFTSTPFQNWTRNTAEVLGTVEADVDWDVDVEAVREHLRVFVASHELWDGRVCGLQVTDATGSFVRLRVLVSACDGPRLFDLRCAVREELVSLLARRQPGALPRVRTTAAVEADRGERDGGERDGRAVPHPRGDARVR